jgi:hypothetical protein
MLKAGNESSTHIYDGEKHGFFHISKGGRKMFENVLGKADEFLVRYKYLSGKDKVKSWTTQAIEHYKKSSKKKSTKNSKK